MSITVISIEKVNQSRDKFNIFLDNGESLVVTSNDLLKNNIAKGETYTDLELDDLKKDILFTSLYNSALIYLGNRPRSVLETRQRLKKKINTDTTIIPGSKKEYSESMIDIVVNKLISSKYLDDTEFAKWFVKQRINQNKGTWLIKSELSQKGVNSGIIEVVLSNITKEEEILHAKKQAEKKLNTYNNSVESNYEKKKKTTRYLMNRGFSYDISKVAVDSILSDN